MKVTTSCFHMQGCESDYLVNIKLKDRGNTYRIDRALINSTLTRQRRWRGRACYKAPSLLDTVTYKIPHLCVLCSLFLMPTHTG